MRRVLTGLVLLVALGTASTVWGWGEGHGEIARLCSRYMPADIRAFLGPWNEKLELWCHYPDMTVPGWGARRFMVRADLEQEIGKEAADAFARWGFRTGNWLHLHEGRAVSLFMLKEAFRTNRPKLAAFCISELSHAVADQGAINHTPILQFTTYSRFAAVDYGWRHGCELTLSQSDVAQPVHARLAAYRPKAFGTSFAGALVPMLMDCYDQSETAAAVEIDAAFGTRAEHAAAMSRLAVQQVAATLDMAYTAWTYRDEPYTLTDDDLARIAPAEEARRRRTDPASQAVYHGLFDVGRNPPHPRATVGFVLEPYGSFHVKTLSYVGKMLGAAYARTLRDRGFAVRPVPLWDLERKELPAPGEMQVLVVFAGGCARLPETVAANVRRYRDAGGRLVWIAGEDPRDVAGFGDVLERRRDDEVPVSSRWAVQNEDVWGRMRLSFSPVFGDLSREPRAFVRNPNFDGFCKPVCLWRVKEAEGVTPLVWLDNGADRFCVGARRGNAVWLPEYLFLPFLLSADRAVDWRDMRLDTFGAAVGVAAVEGLLP